MQKECTKRMKILFSIWSILAVCIVILNVTAFADGNPRRHRRGIKEKG